LSRGGTYSLVVLGGTLSEFLLSCINHLSSIVRCGLGFGRISYTQVKIRSWLLFRFIVRYPVQAGVLSSYELDFD